MTYRSLMVHLELNGGNEELLNVTAELAGRFGARVIGIAACRPLPALYNEGLVTQSAMTADREEMEAELAAAESQFRAALEGRARALLWRASITYGPLADFMAAEARAADLVITGKDIGRSLLDDSRRVNIGDLAMRAGRPLLLVPRGIKSLPLRHAFVGWKESREARRAVADALPLLREAEQVTVLKIASEAGAGRAQEQVDDVASWLEEQGVAATALALAAIGNEAGYLRAELLDRRCDLFVAGAYGHTRLREWVFGGITRDMLLDPDFCVLISH